MTKIQYFQQSICQVSVLLHYNVIAKFTNVWFDGSQYIFFENKKYATQLSGKQRAFI